MNINKITCFERPEPFLRRLALVILGVVIQGFGLSILRITELGVDPCSCLTQGVSNYLPFSFGTCQLLCHLVTFLFVIKFDMSYIGFGTVANMCFLGYISDFFVNGSTYFIPNFIPLEAMQTPVMRYCLLIPGLFFMLFGAAAYMCAGLGSSPYDAAPFIISAMTEKISFKAVRIIWDICFSAAGFLLGGNFGIVTVAVAFFCGPIVAFMRKHIEKLLRTA